jgi:hypothetical protein
MPHIFVGSDAPEADDCDSSWVYYCEEDLESMLDALAVVEHRAAGAGSSGRAAALILRRAIARKAGRPVPVREPLLQPA